MRSSAVALLLCVDLCLSPGLLGAESEPIFRTDSSANDKLPWFPLVEGEFPPEGSAHYYAGELIKVDHLKRSFVLRVDRTDAQNRTHFDLPATATMLPFGSIYYHGAPAALSDIPLGTHLHGLFYVKESTDKAKPLIGWLYRVSQEVDFKRCLRIEDDFSYYSGQKQIWQIDDVDHEKHKLRAGLLKDGKALGKLSTFDLQTSTRIWQGSGFATTNELAKGQLVQLNITWATLYGPGLLRDIWIDDESRQQATSRQTAVHHDYIHQRGVAGWVDAVDNSNRIVTITFFDGVETKLLDEFVKDKRADIAVTNRSLVMYDPFNDRRGGPVLEVKHVAIQPGSSGVQIRVQPDLLLEGYRPGRIVRVFPPTMPFRALPQEEALYGFDQ